METEIQDRKKAEERFRLVVEAAPHSKVLIDPQGRIALVNSQTEMLFGFSREELLGKPLSVLLPAGLPARVYETPGHPVDNRYEVVGRRRDGSSIPLEAGCGRFQTAEGEFELTSLVDITRRKEAESALRASNEELALKKRGVAAQCERPGAAHSGGSSPGGSGGGEQRQGPFPCHAVA
jgi:PAS domain S-box-containing protein